MRARNESPAASLARRAAYPIVDRLALARRSFVRYQRDSIKYRIKGDAG